MTVSNPQDDLRVCWHGPESVLIYGWLKLTISTHDDRRIKHITLQIVAPNFRQQLLATGAAVATELLTAKFLDGLLEPMDGNDERVRKLFGGARLVTWSMEKGSAAKDAAMEVHDAVYRRMGEVLSEAERQIYQRMRIPRY
ncbi:MAG: hypothetical protein R3B70_10730 [Polyangiaceae bacterium]